MTETAASPVHAPFRPGAYFVTLVAQASVPPLARIQGEQATLTVWGEAIREEWFRTPELRPYVRLDPAELLIMPNHLHGVIWIAGAALPEARCSIAPIIHGLKRTSTRRFQMMQGNPELQLWQDGHFEHFIRDAFVLHAVHNYLRLNPAHWSHDLYNPLRRGKDELTQELWAIFRASYEET